jgi:hypothetical protein
MSVSIVSPESLNLIGAARQECADKSGATASAERNYALALNDGFVSDWYAYEANDLTDDGKLVKAEKELFYKALHAAHHNGKHPNPSTVWARVRKYATEAMFGKEESDGGAKHGKSVDLRITDGLVPLYKFLKRQDALNDKQTQVLTYVASALTAFGMDLALIESGK